jgi:thiol-disulfide isomerase/thioredoxin
MAFTVYYREGCSLCEAMIDELQPYCEQPGFELIAVDVDSSSELAATYGTRVPVLVGPAGEISHYFLDTVTLERSLPQR